ncbi:integral membrane [Pyrenophora seminiperda CCB06]|uniref:Integral membrane n=1 Tax=Pyrenophora seminiperda CCB06 TaxID=1302712 RepID=A0A3M7LZI7_9PLEO|nr:integral membrane [Pyrenophora seminiperda CCB06]
MLSNRFDIVNGKQLALLIAPIIFFLAAAVAVAARWHSRSVRRINTPAEDALMLAGLIMSFIVVTLVYVLVFLGGEGLTSDQIKADPTKDFPVVQRFWLRMQFALDICWATSVATVQMGFAQSYVRLYDKKPFARLTCYISMALIAVWYVWSLVGWINMCHPPGKCELQSKKSGIIIGSLHVFFNSVILFVPLPALLAAHDLTTKKKWSVMILFLLGCFCTILAVLRIDCAIDVFGNYDKDPIGASWWRICFSPIEVAVGIICCCVPNVRSLPSWNRDRRVLPTEGTGLRRLKFRTHSSGSSTSNLNEPSNWMPSAAKPQVAAFVTLSDSDALDRTSSLGANEIKVTKEYDLHRL